MMSACLPCVSAPRASPDDAPDYWTLEVLRQLYQQCRQANDGRLIVYGLFARANAVNTNNRLYPKRILLREVKKFVKEAVGGRCALGELDHPSYSSPTFKHLNLVNVSHQVLSVKWKGNALWGFIEVLDTPSGRLVKSLYERGCKLGVSSRGWASLRDLPGKCYKCIMANFELITFDFVTEPSTKGAWLLPYAGRYSLPIPSQATAEAMSRLGVGAVPQEQLAQVPRVRDLQAGFEEFQRRLQAEQRFPVKRMLGPAEWCVSTRSRAGDDASAAKKRSEPAATDTAHPGVFDTVCRGIADGLPRPAPSGSRHDDMMSIPVSNSVVLTYPAPGRPHAPIAYGSYVVHALLYGVPSQHGLRDYWRHAFLFRERAVLSALGPAAIANPLGLPGSTPDAQQRLLDEKIVFTGGLADAKTDSSVVSGSSAATAPIGVARERDDAAGAAGPPQGVADGADDGAATAKRRPAYAGEGGARRDAALAPRAGAAPPRREVEPRALSARRAEVQHYGAFGSVRLPGSDAAASTVAPSYAHVVRPIEALGCQSGRAHRAYGSQPCVEARRYAHADACMPPRRSDGGQRRSHGSARGTRHAPARLEREAGGVRGGESMERSAGCRVGGMRGPAPQIDALGCWR